MNDISEFNSYISEGSIQNLIDTKFQLECLNKDISSVQVSLYPLKITVLHQREQNVLRTT